MIKNPDEKKALELLNNINEELSELKIIIEYLSSVNGFDYKIKLENNKIVVEMEKTEYLRWLY